MLYTDEKRSLLRLYQKKLGLPMTWYFSYHMISKELDELITICYLDIWTDESDYQDSEE